MVAVSFGSYASSAFANNDPNAVKFFAVLLVLAMTALNIAGLNARRSCPEPSSSSWSWHPGPVRSRDAPQHQPRLARPSRLPERQKILSSVALTFFAFLGFGVVTFTAKDLAVRSPAASCDLPSHRHRDGRLRSRRPGRVRDADRRPGHPVRADRDCRGCASRFWATLAFC